MYQLKHYLTHDGVDVIAQWFESLSDRHAIARVQLRLDRLERGLLGDCKPISDGVWELRIDWGAGYRIYYAQTGSSVLLLLCGGDKRKQQTDIERAISYWQDYQRRTK